MFYLILYVLLGILGVIFAILYTNYSVAIFVGVLILFPLFSYILNMIACIMLKIDIQNAQEQIHQEEEFKVQIHIKNRSVLPIINGVLRYSYGYNIGSKERKKFKFSIKARGETVHTLHLKGGYCGSISLRFYRLSVWEYFHVFVFSKIMKEGCEQIIYPKLQTRNLDVRSNTTFYNDEYDEFYEDHPGNDPSEVYEIRDYREGDKLQRIHWKLSSKRERYMVKEYSDPIIIDAAIICDNSCTYGGMERVKRWSDLLEKTIQASYSLLLNKVNHYVYWFDEERLIGERMEVRSEQDFHTCIIRLLQCKPNKNPQAYVNYLIHSEEIETYANVFYVGEGNQELLEEKGISVKVVD